MPEVAKALGRPPMYPTKYFGCELGAQTKYDASNDRYIINGAHDADKLQSLLDGFIDKFVLCSSCKNPETVFVIGKDDKISKDCKACGHNSPVDMNHKLVAFILKTHQTESAAKKNKRDRKKQLVKDTDSAIPTPPETNSVDSDEGADALAREIEEGAPEPVAEYDDDDWVEDTSAEAVAARMHELNISGAAAKLINDEDDDDDPLDKFGEFISANPDAEDAEIVAAAKENGVKDHKACAVLAQVIFTDKILAEGQVEKRLKLFKRFCKNERCQKSILGGIERLVGVNFPELLPKIALILKALYDHELVEEEVFLAWAEKASKKYVDKKTSKEIRAKAEPFLNWLREAEEDDSD